MATPVPYEFLRKLKIENILAREFLAEFWGTFVLVVGKSIENPILRSNLEKGNIFNTNGCFLTALLSVSKLIGDAAFAQTILTGNHVNDVLAVTFAWAIAVILGATVAGGVTGGHLNPAVSLALGTMGKLPWKKVPVFIAAQHLGAFFASAVLFVTYYDMINAFDGGNRTVLGETGTALIWATYPRDTISLGTVFIDQLVATGLLMFTAAAIIDKRNLDMPKWMHPFAIGLMICSLALCFGPNCMAPLNPARDFATRIFTAMAGYGSETFSHMNYNYWWVGGLVGPHLGGIVGGWLYYLCVELHLPDPPKASEHEMKELLDGKKNRALC